MDIPGSGCGKQNSKMTPNDPHLYIIASPLSMDKKIG